MTSAGKGHSWNAEATSEGGAWTEGWPSFFQAVLQNDPIYEDTTDTDYRVNLENGTMQVGSGGWTPLAAKGPKAEGSVATLLWDLWDGADGSTDSDKDGIAIDFKCLWWASDSNSTLNLPVPKTIKDFYSNLVKVLESKGFSDWNKLKSVFEAHNITGLPWKV
ncbi:MAG: hypothetical protein ACE5OZ_26115 [Candidatus Heimdallarchaeota archaeon]